MSFALIFKGFWIQLIRVLAAMTIPRTKSIGWIVSTASILRPRTLLGLMVLVVLRVTSEDG